jgi:hypothetical protein
MTLTIPIDEATRENAKLILQGREVLKNSILHGAGSMAGTVGELAVAKFMKAKHAPTFDYDLLHGTLRIDVKTKQSHYAPRQNFRVNLPCVNITQKCDWYVWTFVDYDLTTCWIAGYSIKTEMPKLAVLRKKGEVNPDNGFIHKCDSLELRVDQLHSL